MELIYRAKGLDRETAKAAAAKIMSNPETALDTLAREELGLDPDELGSPVKVAASSFVAFASGAVVPVIPYVFLSGTAALVTAIVPPQSLCRCWRHCWTPVGSRCRKVGRPPTVCRRRRGSGHVRDRQVGWGQSRLASVNSNDRLIDNTTRS